MKSCLALLCFSMFLFWGCSSNESNPVGGGFAKTREQKRVTDSVSLVVNTDHGLEAYSRKTNYAWGSAGVCRTGFFMQDTFYAYLEFNIPPIPKDFDSLKDAGLPDSLDRFHGIDSIGLRFCFENNSAYSYSSLDYDLIILQCLTKSAIVRNSLVQWLDDSLLLPLGTFHLHLPAPAESAFFAIPLKDTTEPLFNYIRNAVLNRGASDSATIRLAIRLSDTDQGKPILTFKSANPAVITLFGHYRQKLCTYINGIQVCGNTDTLMTDSVKSQVRYAAYTAVAHDPSLFTGNPVASTVNCQQWNNTDTAGSYYAVFKINRDSIFRNLNPDSINILKATARFQLNQDSSYSEENRTLAVRMRCLFYNAQDQQIQPGENVYFNMDTLIQAFSATDSSFLRFPVDKFLAALTDSRYRAVTSVEFDIRTDPISLNRMGRLLFRKEVGIQFKYSER